MKKNASKKHSFILDMVECFVSVCSNENHLRFEFIFYAINTIVTHKITNSNNTKKKNMHEKRCNSTDFFVVSYCSTLYQKNVYYYSANV